MVFTPTFALLSIVLVPTIVSITIGSSIPRQYLRLSFDGGSRGFNELGSGGAVLHFCYDENISFSDLYLMFASYSTYLLNIVA